MYSIMGKGYTKHMNCIQTWHQRVDGIMNTNDFSCKKGNFAPRIAFSGKESSFFTTSSAFSGYGARYLESRTGRWLSADPAMGEYIPSAGQDTAKLPGLGGIYNTVNFHTYAYSFNNPVRYIDPNGESGSFPDGSPEQNAQWEKGMDRKAGFNSEGMNDRFADNAMERRGPENYVWGGKIPEKDGGTDCSGTVDWAAEKTVGQKILDRNADTQVKDTNFTVPGDNSRGSLNFYDWNDDGVYDHVTINLGDGKEINPYGGDSNTKDNPAPILIKAIPTLKEGQTMINRNLKWRHLAR